MPEYLAPGVYVEETSFPSKPIAGVPSGVAAFIGVVGEKTLLAAAHVLPPAGQPCLVTNFSEFTMQFGDTQAANLNLAHAVAGFFQNGGQRCWVSRVAAPKDLPGEAVFAALAAIDEIALVAAPGITTTAMHQALLDHCQACGDRFAILDGVRVPASPTAADICPAGRSEAGSYGAVYFPWLVVPDAGQPGGQAVVPPSGHVAGYYVQVDATHGLHKSPAGDVLHGVIGLESHLDKAQCDALNPQGIDVIADFNGAIRVWGARTLADDAHAEYRYVCVRRYMNTLRESIDKGTQWVAFEADSPLLHTRVVQSVDDFLMSEWRSGALLGTKPEQAFFVRCDATTTTAAAAGWIVLLVGVALVRPAEFLLFRLRCAVAA